MASQADELDVNPFFRSLQTTFHGKFDEAQSKCWTICVPKSSSIKGLKITGQIIDYHILKPSRYFKSQFVSTDKGESRAYEIDDGKIQIVAGNCIGYSVKILSEELSYNEVFKPYKLFIINRPLDPFSVNRVRRADSSENRNTARQKVSFRDCSSFLWSFNTHQEVLNNLDKKLNIFNQNYIVLPDYLHDASKRLQDIVRWGFKALLDCQETPLDELDPLSIDLKSCLESYVLGKVHLKLFAVIRQKYMKEDQALADRLQELYSLDLTPDQLGVKESFCCALPGAVVELATLNSLVTPCEKLNCLKTSLENIPEDIFNAFKLADNPFKKLYDAPNLTSDDLIPLLVSVLVQARVQYLESNLFYIQNFTWSLSPRDKQSFSLVSFQAAKEFVKTHNFSHMQPSTNKLKKEMSLEELMEVTVELQKQGKNDKDAKGDKGSDKSGGNRAVSPIDRQLERITRMIEDSTRDLRQQEPGRLQGGSLQGMRRNMETEQYSRESLGDFLSTLQQDSFGVTFGKQT